MKKYIITSLMLLLAVSFWNCEKDDICSEDTPTTPKLIIEFYDNANQTELKNVTNLGIVETSLTEGFAFNAVSTITVPLRTNQDTTTINFVLNGSDDDATNDISDVITFNYSRIETYISRACGYKTTFILNDTDGLVIPTTNWISSFEIVQPNINNEDETHVKIYF
ncbi:DUF6452 family protein [uncultured Flavobacterium sp.]|uniref:DUF6452 family protein n=1 Tax=uncultured Flavobacterium sp. TaxID=165435 RepID=UPI0030EBC5D4